MGDNHHGRAQFYKFLHVKNLKVKKIVFRFGAKLALSFEMTKRKSVKMPEICCRTYIYRGKSIAKRHFKGEIMLESDGERAGAHQIPHKKNNVSNRRERPAPKRRKYLRERQFVRDARYGDARR